MASQKKIKFTIFVLLITFSFGLSAQKSNDSLKIINYYGLIASDLDSNMSKMTSDLYYTQLCEIQDLNIIDFRSDNINSRALLDNDTINTEIFSKENINLYFKVNKIIDTTKWSLTLYLQNNKTDNSYTEIKEYDSFYKILMEPKSSLQETLKKLIYNHSTEKNDSSEKTEITFSDFSDKQNLSTEEFSGTWSGENYIDKIVILRGGRGFVIFNNGSSMNISVQIKKVNSKDSVIITQTSRPNASFFPNLDRKLALSYANSAAPIEWNFQIVDSNTLSGTKKTLLQDNDGILVTEGEEKVTWNRKS